MFHERELGEKAQSTAFPSRGGVWIGAQVLGDPFPWGLLSEQACSGNQSPRDLLSGHKSSNSRMTRQQKALKLITAQPQGSAVPRPSAGSPLGALVQ